MKPAARLGDMHMCPMLTPGLPPIPHIGGPIISPCYPPVIIGNMPAARVSDMCICIGPPDTIIQGSPTVFIGNMPAARMGDMTVHGGVIITGIPTVVIGDKGGSPSSSWSIPGVGTTLSLVFDWLAGRKTENSMLELGNENANIKVGAVNYSLKSKFGYDLEKRQLEFSPLEAKVQVAAVRASAKGSLLNNLVNGQANLEVASASANVQLSGKISSEAAQVDAKVGAEAALIKGDASGSLRLTPTTVYNNTIGRVTNTTLSSMFDKGLVIEGKGDAGIAAAAQAGAGAGVTEHEAYVYASAKLGLGPMAGAFAKVGIIW